MPSMSDMIISALLKKGVLYEARNVEIDVPVTVGDKERTISIKADHMKLEFRKGKDDGDE